MSSSSKKSATESGMDARTINLPIFMVEGYARKNP